MIIWKAGGGGKGVALEYWWVHIQSFKDQWYVTGQHLNTKVSFRQLESNDTLLQNYRRFQIRSDLQRKLRIPRENAL